MLPIHQVLKAVGWSTQSTHIYTECMLAFLLCSCFWNRIDYLCILCYLQPDPYFSFFQQDVCADGIELLLQERGTFEPYFERRDCCFIACSPLRHVHTRNIKRMPLKISFFGRTLALRTSAAPNTTKSFRTENCRFQRGALLVTGIVL